MIRSRPGGQEVTNDRAGGKQRHERHFQMHDSAQGHGQPHMVNIWVHVGALSTAWRAHAYGQARAMRRGKGMSGRRGMWCVGDIDERAPSCELNKHTTQPARKHTARARTARARAAGARNASTGSASAHTHAQHQNKAPAGAPPTLTSEGIQANSLHHTPSTQAHSSGTQACAARGTQSESPKCAHRAGTHGARRGRMHAHGACRAPPIGLLLLRFCSTLAVVPYSTPYSVKFILLQRKLILLHHLPNFSPVPRVQNGGSIGGKVPLKN